MSVLDIPFLDSKLPEKLLKKPFFFWKLLQI